MNEHGIKIVISIIIAALLAIPSAAWWFYTSNAWASDVSRSMQEIAKDMRNDRITRLRNELNEIEQKELDKAATKYDLLRKRQLERDYTEELRK